MDDACELVLSDDFELDRADQILLRSYTTARKITVLQRLDEGKSSATVLLVDIVMRRSTDRPYEGRNVLKIDRPDLIRAEIAKHHDARRIIGQYVPELVDQIGPQGERLGLILELAGGSSLSVKSVAKVVREKDLTASELAEMLGRFNVQVLERWNPVIELDRKAKSPRDWLLAALNCGSTSGERFDEVLALNVLCDTTSRLLYVPEFDRKLPNPLAYTAHADIWTYNASITAPIGRLHGDLHAANLLCRTDRITNVPYLIDFVRGQDDDSSIIFYDLAYLELDLLMQRMHSQPWATWGDLLNGLCVQCDRESVLPVEPRDDYAVGTFRIVSPLRQRVDAIIHAAPQSIQSDFITAWWLAATAVGLVYARRENYHGSQGRRERLIGFLYAAHCLDRVLQILPGEYLGDRNLCILPLEDISTINVPTVTRDTEIVYAQIMREHLHQLDATYVELSGEHTSEIINPKKPKTTFLGEIRSGSKYHERFATALLLEAPVINTDANNLLPGRPLASVRDELRNADRVVLLGEPGSGKTWTLRRLALAYAADLEQNAGALIPVFVPLASYRGRSEADFAVFVREQLEDSSPKLAEQFELLCRSDRLVLLCDALNEMPRDAAGEALHSLHLFLKPIKKLAVSCRHKEFNRGDLVEAGTFGIVEIKPLTPLLMRETIDTYLYQRDTDEMWMSFSNIERTTLWYDHLLGNNDLLAAWQIMHEGGYAEAFWQNADPPNYLLEALDPREVARRTMLNDPKGLMLLCRNPYMLFLVMEIFQKSGRIPAVRGALFGQFVNSLLSREQTAAEQRNEPWSPILKERLVSGLTHLAERMQFDNVTDLSKQDVLELLNDEQLLPLAFQCSILQENRTIVRFSHQLLQEFFVSRVMSADVDAHIPATQYWASDKWWEPTEREQTALILAGVRAAEGRQKLIEMIQWLALAQPELALSCIKEVDDTYANMDSAVRDALIDSARVKQDDSHPYGRVAAYRVLGTLNADERFGIGLNAGGLPAFDWVEIPIGDFIMGRDKDKDSDKDSDNPKRSERIERVYQMSRYPVTYAQYKAFLDAEDGYHQTRWWELLNTESQAQQAEGPGVQRWAVSNYPAENVSWYDAMAFCAWLTSKLGYEVRLPTEKEWEKAARGTDGREYPWGNGYVSGFANIGETVDEIGPYYVQQTSAVGIYPQGMSPYGILDMAGNVREWMWNEYGNPLNIQVETNKWRGTRGGAWGDWHIGARASSRFWGFPLARESGLGFRLVCVTTLQ